MTCAVHLRLCLPNFKTLKHFFFQNVLLYVEYLIYNIEKLYKMIQCVCFSPFVLICKT